MPGAGHIVHMPGHIYYRVGLYREALQANIQAIAVDERYFQTSPSDPMYRGAYYPHNIHFLMVSAQMGGDATTALASAAKLDASMPVDMVKAFAIMQPVKAAPYTTHAQFSTPGEILRLPAPDADLVLVRVMYHYARALAHAGLKDVGAAQHGSRGPAGARGRRRLQALRSMGACRPRRSPRPPRLVAAARLADAQGNLEGAAAALEAAVRIEDGLAYTEPPYWYYPVRQSLGAIRLRQGQLDAAEGALRESLTRVRNNGWALAGLAEVYKRKGEVRAEQATRAALKKAWFGPAEGPELGRL